jgi:hypothetical protein
VKIMGLKPAEQPARMKEAHFRPSGTVQTARETAAKMLIDCSD